MASRPLINAEGMSTRSNLASLTLKAPLSRSEEYLTRISTELTNEALFIAGCNMNPEPFNQKHTQDQETQISRQGSLLPAFFTQSRGTDTCSDRNYIYSKENLLPSPSDKGTLPSNLTPGA